VKVETQAAEIDSLGRQVRLLEARSKAVEEQVNARAGAPATAKSAPAKPAEGETGAPAGPEPLTGEVAVTAEAVGTFLDTEQGRQRIREAVAAEDRRKQEEARAQRREQTMSFIKERVTGSLAEALGLDAKQQQTVITIAADTMERMEEIWRGARDGGQGNPQFFADARQKATEVMTQTQEKLQQALTADQYTKLQELNAEGNGLMPGRGFGGLGGFGGGGGRGPGGGGGGGAPQAPGGGR
jgi:hypothetical protein